MHERIRLARLQEKDSLKKLGVDGSKIFQLDVKQHN